MTADPEAVPSRRSSTRWFFAVIAAGAMLVMPSGLAAQDAAADPLPEQGTVLEAGRYVSDQVGPTIDFRVGDGWVVGPSASGPIFTLEYLPSPGTVLSVTRFDGETFLDSCDPTSMTLVEPSVSRLAEIIAGNPYLNAGASAAIDVDGHGGIWLDVGVPLYTECALPYVLVWAVPMGDGGEFVQMANQQSRFVLLDVGGDVIVVAIESFPGVPFGGLLEASMEIIDTMRIEPGEYVPASPEPSDAPATSAPPETESPPSPSPTEPAEDPASA